MTSIVESLIEDGLRLLPAVATLIVAYMVLRTWVKTRSAGSTLLAVVVGVLVVGFVSDQGGFASLLWAELQARAGQ